MLSGKLFHQAINSCFLHANLHTSPARVGLYVHQPVYIIPTQITTRPIPQRQPKPTTHRDRADPTCRQQSWDRQPHTSPTSAPASPSRPDRPPNPPTSASAASCSTAPPDLCHPRPHTPPHPHLPPPLPLSMYNQQQQPARPFTSHWAQTRSCQPDTHWNCRETPMRSSAVWPSMLLREGLTRAASGASSRRQNCFRGALQPGPEPEAREKKEAASFFM